MTTTPPKKKRNYINNPDFLQALIDYKAACIEAKKNDKPEPIVPNYIGDCFIKIATNLSRKPNFASYSFRDEMIADGIENSIMYFRNFNPDKYNNPFAYFTQIIYYAFLRRIAREKKQLYVKYKATEQFGILDEGEMYEDENGNMKQFEMYDNISEFIYTFEETKKAKKKLKSKGLEKFVEPDPEITEEPEGE